jgi:plasmid stabilization system protein ParE
MALTIEFSRRSTSQLQKILVFYDERNGSTDYSRRLLRCLLEELQRLAKIPTASSPSTRPDVRFFYLMGFTIIFRYNHKRLTVLSIRSSQRKPLRLYVKP